MKILITGASGFFGQNLVETLKNSNKNFECYIVYKNNKLLIEDDRFKSLRCNILKKQETKELLESIKPTHIVHLAWYVEPQKFWTSFENIDWLYASLNLFKEFGKNKGEIFIGAGSLAEYDWSNGILEEVTPTIPATLYGSSKKSLCQLLHSVKNAYNFDTKIIWPRIGYFFGKNEPVEKLIPKLINCIKNGIPIDLADKEFERPYSNINYIGKILQNILFMNMSKDIIAFNLSSTKNYSLKTIVETIEKITHKKAIVNYGAYKSNPLNIEVKTNWLKENNLFIEDTFLDDLKDFIHA